MSSVLLSRTLVTFFLAFSATIADLLVASSSFPVDATHVPTFCVPQHEGPSYINVIPSLLFHVAHLIVCGCIFHCAGWNFHSPTDAEQTLWRVASVAVTVIPTLLSGLPTFLDTSGFSIEDTMKMAMIFMLMYLSARLILLGQAIALLHQPTRYIYGRRLGQILSPLPLTNDPSCYHLAFCSALQSSFASHAFTLSRWSNVPHRYYDYLYLSCAIRLLHIYYTFTGRIVRAL